MTDNKTWSQIHAHINKGVITNKNNCTNKIQCNISTVTTMETETI